MKKIAFSFITAILSILFFANTAMAASWYGEASDLRSSVWASGCGTDVANYSLNLQEDYLEFSGDMNLNKHYSEALYSHTNLQCSADIKMGNQYIEGTTPMASVADYQWEYTEGNQYYTDPDTHYAGGGYTSTFTLDNSQNIYVENSSLIYVWVDSYSGGNTGSINEVSRLIY